MKYLKLFKESLSEIENTDIIDFLETALVDICDKDYIFQTIIIPDFGTKSYEKNNGRTLLYISKEEIVTDLAIGNELSTAHYNANNLFYYNNIDLEFQEFLIKLNSYYVVGDITFSFDSIADRTCGVSTIDKYQRALYYEKLRYISIEIVDVR